MHTAGVHRDRDLSPVFHGLEPSALLRSYPIQVHYPSEATEVARWIQ